MGFSAAGIALDSIIEKDIIFKWDTVKEGVDSHFHAMQGVFALQPASAVHKIGRALKCTSDLHHDEIGLGSFFVPKDGTYEIFALVTTQNDFGDYDVKIDGAVCAGMDFYTAGLIRNSLFNVTLGALTKGLKTISLEAERQNIASIGFMCELQAILIIKTP